jgi:hypothetical protein
MSRVGTYYVSFLLRKVEVKTGFQDDTIVEKPAASIFKAER